MLLRDCEIWPGGPDTGYQQYQYSLATMAGFIDRTHGRGRTVIFGAENANSAQEREYSLAFYFMISNGGDAVGNDVMNPYNWSLSFIQA